MVNMVMCSLVHLFVLTLVARLRADDFQSILTQISTGNNDCNIREELLGGFNFKTVPQFDALCNIPIPDIKQSEFLIKNNVVPILCMGLMDVSLRLCKSANNGISPFKDIFPPSSVKFSQIFVELSKSNDFSSLDVFCSTTVKKFTIQEAASNVTEPWWQLMNRQLADASHCSNICHSNEGSNVHPLCSYILWANGVYINYRKNQAQNQQLFAVEEDEKPPAIQKNEGAVNQEEKTEQVIGNVKSELPTEPSKPLVSSDIAPLADEKTKTLTETKSNVVTDTNNVGVGTVEQLVDKGDEAAVTNIVQTNINTSVDVSKLVKKDEKLKSKHKIKDSPTKISDSNKILVKPAPSLAGQVEVKDGPKVSDVAGSNASGPQGPVPPESEPQPGKAAEGMVETDFSLEVTPDGVTFEEPVPSEKDFQHPGYPDEEGEDGDGDDVDIMETNAHAANNNRSTPAESKLSGSGSVASIQQSPLEGDRVYGEGEILIEDHFIEAEDSHFFTYFLCMAVLTIMAYLAFHNKKKLIALAVEGRRSKGGRRRPNSSHYSKLDCSLEEALVSNTTASVTHVLY